MNTYDIFKQISLDFQDDLRQMADNPQKAPNWAGYGRQILKLALHDQDLPQLVLSAIESLQEELTYLHNQTDKPLTQLLETEALQDLLFETADYITPSKTFVQETLSYLYPELLEPALERQGFFVSKDNHMASSIFCYLLEQLKEFVAQLKISLQAPSHRLGAFGNRVTLPLDRSDW